MNTAYSSISVNQEQAKPATLMLRPFVLLGVERSGSTLLRLMLDHHPELSCMFESDFMLEAAPETDPDGRHLLANWHFRHCNLVYPKHARSCRELVTDFFRQRGAQTGKTIVGATFHHQFERLPTLFPAARYVHLLRDGRPVAASMVQMGWVGTTYHGAKTWAAALREIESARANVPDQNWIDVRYEDLVRQPRETLKRICDHLGVAFSERMLHYDGDTSYEAPDATNAQRWRTRMTPRDIELAEMGAGELLDQLGYPRLMKPPPPGRIERLFLAIEDRLNRAVFNCRRYGPYMAFGRKTCRWLHIPSARLDRRWQAIREAHIK